MIKNNGSDSIVLVGMPGTGKTTVGKLLAEIVNYTFIDTDQLVTDRTGKTPRQLVDESGREYFLKVQDEAVLGICLNNTVIATGGGLVHSDAAMKHLKADGSVVFLSTSYQTIEDRMDKSRKLVRNGGSLQDLYNERTPLYRKYSDIIIECDDMEPIEICNIIIKLLSIEI